jgi:hypothetical protein
MYQWGHNSNGVPDIEHNQNEPPSSTFSQHNVRLHEEWTIMAEYSRRGLWQDVSPRPQLPRVGPLSVQFTLSACLAICFWPIPVALAFDHSPLATRFGKFQKSRIESPVPPEKKQVEPWSGAARERPAT